MNDHEQSLITEPFIEVPTLHRLLNINTYLADGFEKVCDVRADPYDTFCWTYDNINIELMYSTHKSWIYFIVDEEELVKVGESGNPLGIKKLTGNFGPKSGTMSRLGRYMRNGDTDERIRDELRQSVLDGTVSIWARKCETVKIDLLVGGEKIETVGAFHKDMELQYLDLILNGAGQLPRLNVCRR